MRDITKPRILYIYKYLFESSSATHPVSKRDIMNKLQNDHGLSVNRVTLINDLKMLMEAGVPIKIIPQGRKYTYYYDGRVFDSDNLNTLADVVAASPLLNTRGKQQILGKLEKLSAPFEPFEKKRNVTVTYTNLIPIIDVLNEAINTKRQISFYDFEYVVEKDKIQKKKGEKLVVSPYSIIWEYGHYNLVCLHVGEIWHFQLDSMYKVPEILDEEIVPMPEEELIEATVLCDKIVLHPLIENFGKDDIKVSSAGDEQFRAVIKGEKEDIFYWINAWDEEVKIEGPEEIVEEYRKFCEDEMEGIY